MPMYTFEIDYGSSKFAEACIAAYLMRKGWRNAEDDEDGDAATLVLSWTKASKVNWERFLTPHSTLVLGCYPLCTALTAKHLLAGTIAASRRTNFLLSFLSSNEIPVHYLKMVRQIIECLHPESHVIRSSKDGLCVMKRMLRNASGVAVQERQLVDLHCDNIFKNRFQETSQCWFMKESNTNNSLGIKIGSLENLYAYLLTATNEEECAEVENGAPSKFCSKKPPASLASKKHDVPEKSMKGAPPELRFPLILQRSVQNLILFYGRKFHCRVHVLFLGDLYIYLCRDIVCHVSTMPYGRFDEVGTQDTSNQGGVSPIAMKEENHGDTEDLSYTRMITNSSWQRRSSQYKREQHTILLQELCTRENALRCASHTPTGFPCSQEYRAQAGHLDRGPQCPHRIPHDFLCYNCILASIALAVRLLLHALRPAKVPNEAVSVSTNNASAFQPPLSCSAVFSLEKGDTSNASGCSASIASIASEEAKRPTCFLPHARSFEIFGFDFLLCYSDLSVPISPGDSSQRLPLNTSSESTPSKAILSLPSHCSVVPVLLEVNRGPALESACWKDMCKTMVRNILDLVTDSMEHSGFLKKEEGTSILSTNSNRDVQELCLLPPPLRPESSFVRIY